MMIYINLILIIPVMLHAQMEPTILMIKIIVRQYVKIILIIIGHNALKAYR